MSWYGWIGAATLIGGEILLARGNAFVATWFTPLMWTGYLLLADALVLRRTGHSRWLHRPRETGWMLILSVLSWLIFEVYNLKLMNWGYVGLPTDPLERTLGFLWSFATITPAIFVTADLLHALGTLRGTVIRPRQISPALLSLLFVVGLACIAIPPALPDWLAPYTFAAVWIGFVPLLEPLNLRLGAPSLLREWLAGRPGPVARFLLAGLVCGFLWEVWNFQTRLYSGAGWIYTFPTELRPFGISFGAMPMLGLIGFLPFALECYAIFYFLRWALGGDALVEPTDGR